MTRFPVGPRQCAVASQVHTISADALDPLNPMPRAMRLGLAAGESAWANSGVAGSVERERVGLAVGTGVGMSDLIEEVARRRAGGELVPPVCAYRGFGHALTCELLRRLDVRGPQATVTTGCNSGMSAIGMGLDWIRMGRADVVLAGGTEAEVTPGFWAAMSAAKALCTSWNHDPARASRPFDRKRGGNVPGEGAAFVVLERESHALSRGAKPIARVLGWASRGSGMRPPYDPFNPTPDPEPLVRTMREAMRDADIAESDVGIVSANGSASVFYDAMEAQAIASVFGAKLGGVHSIKGALGQTGAVTPALQVCAAAMAVRDGVAPPTINCDDPDPACPIDIVASGPRVFDRTRAVLCNAIGFGGQYYDAMVFGSP
jgi:3-oxoacyl-[acyl-carrier-protein] synthase II